MYVQVFGPAVTYRSNGKSPEPGAHAQLKTRQGSYLFRCTDVNFNSASEGESWPHLRNKPDLAQFFSAATLCFLRDQMSETHCPVAHLEEIGISNSNLSSGSCGVTSKSFPLQLPSSSRNPACAGSSNRSRLLCVRLSLNSQLFPTQLCHHAHRAATPRLQKQSDDSTTAKEGDEQ